MQNNSMKAPWPLIASLVIYWAVLAVMVAVSIGMNDGHFVYPLDDTYIHMAIAKNFVLHGVWGVTEYGFTSSTSSPLWTVLLVIVYSIFGVNEMAPIILNILFGTFLLWSADLILGRYIEKPATRFWILIILVFTAPMPTLTFISMEHVLHGLLTLWFVYLSVQAITSPQTSTKQYTALLAIAFFLTVTRYEGLFTVAIVSALLLVNRKWRPAFMIGIVGLLPVILYGIWSVANGWYFIPNSILIKANTSTLSIGGGDIPFALQFILANLVFAPHLVVLVVASIVFAYRQIGKSIWTETTYLNIIFAGISLLQVVFARVGWLFRYEAYLVVLGLVVFSMTMQESFSRGELLKSYTSVSTLRRVWYTFIVVIFILPFIYRIFDSLRKTSQASNNIYDQQYQMARFLKRYYPSASVAVNDIGAVSYFTDIQLVDLAALGSMESARAKLLGGYSTATMRDIGRVKNVQIALVYERWFEQYGGLPAEWKKVGEWEVQNNVTLGGPVVAFLAVDLTGEQRLKQNLLDFGSQLPQNVNQYGEYLNQ